MTLREAFSVILAAFTLAGFLPQKHSSQKEFFIFCDICSMYVPGANCFSSVLVLLKHFFRRIVYIGIVCNWVSVVHVSTLV